MSHWADLGIRGFAPPEMMDSMYTERLTDREAIIVQKVLVNGDQDMDVPGGTNFAGFVDLVHEVEQAEHRAKKHQRRFDTICQSGVNLGVSAVAFLCGTTHSRVKSFELGSVDANGNNNHAHVAQDILDQRYPLRHQTIPGDSTLTLPLAVAENHLKCDFVFVDGGHTREVVNSDIENFKLLSSPGTTVVIDNCNVWNMTNGWGGMPDVSTSYIDAVRRGEIQHRKQISSGSCSSSIGSGDRFLQYCREICVGEYI